MTQLLCFTRFTGKDAVWRSWVILERFIDAWSYLLFLFTTELRKV